MKTITTILSWLTFLSEVIADARDKWVKHFPEKVGAETNDKAQSNGESDSKVEPVDEEITS